MGFKADKTCPKCESADYRFRGRKTVGDEVETRYLCTPCGHQWKVRVAATPAAVPPAELPLWEVAAPGNL